MKNNPKIRSQILIISNKKANTKNRIKINLTKVQ